MRALSLKIIGLIGAVALMVFMPLSALSQPMATTPSQGLTDGLQAVDYGYRTYRYARRPYYRPYAYNRPYYRPYYRPNYYRPYYRPYYQPYRRPQVSVWFGF